MIVLRTHIVYHDGYLQPLFECENNVWFVQFETYKQTVQDNEVTVLRTIQIPPEEAKKYTSEIIDTDLFTPKKQS